MSRMDALFFSSFSLSLYLPAHQMNDYLNPLTLNDQEKYLMMSEILGSKRGIRFHIIKKEREKIDTYQSKMWWLTESAAVNNDTWW